MWLITKTTKNKQVRIRESNSCISGKHIGPCKWKLWATGDHRRWQPLMQKAGASAQAKTEIIAFWIDQTKARTLFFRNVIVISQGFFREPGVFDFDRKVSMISTSFELWHVQHYQIESGYKPIKRKITVYELLKSYENRLVELSKAESVLQEIKSSVLRNIL